MKELKMIGVILAWILIGLGVFIFVIMPIWHKFSCSPNNNDVKIMKPQAKAIANYIVENGIPKSLKDIPKLPYGVVECEKIQHNLERCIFYKNTQKYDVEIYIFGNVDIKTYSEETKTGLRYTLRKNNLSNEWSIVKEDIAFSSKSSGICKPFGRQ